MADYAPAGWVFEYIQDPFVSQEKKGLAYVYQIYRYAKNFKSMFRDTQNTYLLFIKPLSPLLILWLRCMGYKVFSDVNDPIHLPEHLGEHAWLKTYSILRFSNGVIFESPEYRMFWAKCFLSKSTVIEDTPQFTTIFSNYETRLKRVVWFGSPETSVVLLQFVDTLLVFQSFGYELLLMASGPMVQEKLKQAGLFFRVVDSYSHPELVETLSSSAIAFVPMPDNNPSFLLRGNLKAKFPMACGCVTIASDIPMHKRLIEHKKTGYLFKCTQDINIILSDISESTDKGASVAKAGNRYVSTTFTQEDHAKKIVAYIEKT